MRHRRFIYRCPSCQETGLRPDPEAVYKVRVCEPCAGKGKTRITVMQRIELDRELRGGRSKCSRNRSQRVLSGCLRSTLTGRAKIRRWSNSRSTKRFW